jgi:hypothetical protein
MTEYKQIVLEPNQVPHVKRMMEILSYSHLAADTSQLGLGKTFTNSAVALIMKFTDVFAVATSSLESRWEFMGDVHGLPLRLVTSYQSFRSTWGHQPKHGLLKRIDTVNEKGKKHTSFEPTQYLLDLLSTKEGATDTEGRLLVDEYGQPLKSRQCLFIFDEFQHIKNDTDQRDACVALSKAVLSSKGTSRMIFISGGPFVKEDHVINFLKLAGIIRSYRLSVYHNDEGRLELIGAQEVINYCNHFDPEGTSRFIAENPFTKANVKSNCYRLYIKILQEYITSNMRGLSPEEEGPNPITLNISNLFVNMSPENQKMLENAVGKLRNVAAFDEHTGTYDTRRVNWKAIDQSLMLTEQSKWDDFFRLAKHDLDSNPNAKVVIGLNWDKGWNELYRRFEAAGYRPLLIYGKVNKKKRPKIFEQFQEHNNNYRILIGNLRVIGEGLDLDDKFGDQPRSAYGSASYYAQYMHQFTGRFKRGNFTKSDAKVRFIYGKAGRMETSILNSLAKKGKIMGETLPQQVSDGVKFPDEYVTEIEPDPAGITTNFKLVLPRTEKRELPVPIATIYGKDDDDYYAEEDEDNDYDDLGLNDDDTYQYVQNNIPLRVNEVEEPPKIFIPPVNQVHTHNPVTPAYNGIVIPTTNAFRNVTQPFNNPNLLATQPRIGIQNTGTPMLIPKIVPRVTSTQIVTQIPIPVPQIGIKKPQIPLPTMIKRLQINDSSNVPLQNNLPVHVPIVNKSPSTAFNFGDIPLPVNINN